MKPLSEKIINQEPEKWKRGYPIFHSAVLVDDVAEALEELKKKLSKFMLLDGYIGEIRGKKYSMNLILEEIFGEFSNHSQTTGSANKRVKNQRLESDTSNSQEKFKQKKGEKG